ncbi:universal stress protein [Chloroflexi bacterium TSY]|nr:universal stress protein [Chloroflexi bacterium TSY]
MTKNKVLILLDGSEFRERTLPHVRRYIPPTDNDLILFRVGDPPRTLYFPDEMLIIDLYLLGHHQVQATIPAQLRDELLTTKDALEEAGYAVAGEARLGNVAQEVEHYITARDIDLVAMTVRDRIDMSKVLYGCIAEHIRRHVTIPAMSQFL